MPDSVTLGAILTPGLPTSRFATYLMLVSVVMVWGSYPALMKIALVDMPPFTLAALRCLLASAILIGVTWRATARGEALPTRADLPGILVLGISGITVSTALFYVAVSLTTASNAVILTASTPVLVVVGGHLFFGERLDRRQWAGVACSGLGVLATVTRGELRVLETPPRPGDALVLVGQVAWATYTLYGKRVLARLSPRAATAAAYVTGTLFLIPLAVVTAPLFPAPRLGSAAAWAVIVFQGTLGTLSHVWYYRGVQTVGPSVTAIFMNLQPLTGLAFTALILGERLSAAQAVGAATILAGVWLATGRRRADPGLHSPGRREHPGSR
jgi:drug/metabolite transporter (DMT)-like permease